MLPLFCTEKSPSIRYCEVVECGNHRQLRKYWRQSMATLARDTAKKNHDVLHWKEFIILIHHKFINVHWDNYWMCQVQIKRLSIAHCVTELYSYYFVVWDWSLEVHPHLEFSKSNLPQHHPPQWVLWLDDLYPISAFKLNIQNDPWIHKLMIATNNLPCNAFP